MLFVVLIFSIFFDLRLPQLEFFPQFSDLIRVASAASRQIFPELRQPQSEQNETCDRRARVASFGRVAAAATRKKMRKIFPGSLVVTMWHAAARAKAPSPPRAHGIEGAEFGWRAAARPSCHATLCVLGQFRVCVT